MKNLIYLLLMVSCKKSVIPSAPFGCACTTDSMILVQDGDVSQLQFGLSPVTGDNLISNGDFASSSGWTVGAAWNITAGHAVHSVGVDNDLSRTLDYVISAGYYRIKLDFTSGSALFGLAVLLGGDQITTIIDFGGDAVDQTLYLYGYTSASNQTLIIRGNAASDFSVDNVEVVAMSGLQFDILNCDDDEIILSQDYSDGNIEYFNQDLIISVTAGVTNDSMGVGMITIDWDSLGLSEGCYRVCVKDAGFIGYNYIKNGYFGSSLAWTIANTGASGWSISGNAEHAPGGTAGNDDIYQTLVTEIPEDTCFTLSFDYAMVSGSGSATILGLMDRSDGLTDQSLFSTTVSTNGTYTLSGNTSNYGITKIKFRATAAGLRIFNIDNVKLTPTQECTPCVCESVCLAYHQSWDTEASAIGACNMLLRASNDNNSLGYNFVNFDFEHQFRVIGNLRNPKYDFPDEDYYKKSNGEKLLVSSGYEKFKELQIMRMNEGAHDIFSLMLIHQNFSIEIGGVEQDFIKRPGSLAPMWTKRTGDAFVIAEVCDKVQDYFNNLG